MLRGWRQVGMGRVRVSRTVPQEAKAKLTHCLLRPGRGLPCSLSYIPASDQPLLDSRTGPVPQWLTCCWSWGSSEAHMRGSTWEGA